MKNRRWLVSGVLSIAIAVFGLVLPLRTRAEKVQNVSVPVVLTAFVPCANGGVGEDVTLSGDLHIVINVTENQAGGVHVKQHFQPQGISGEGAVTGDTYHATGVTQDEVNLSFGAEETMINNFRIIGPGPDNNFLVHETLHITINANGDVTAFVDNASVECR